MMDLTSIIQLIKPELVQILFLALSYFGNYHRLEKIGNLILQGRIQNAFYYYTNTGDHFRRAKGYEIVNDEFWEFVASVLLLLVLLSGLGYSLKKVRDILRARAPLPPLQNVNLGQVLERTADTLSQPVSSVSTQVSRHSGPKISGNSFNPRSSMQAPAKANVPEKASPGSPGSVTGPPKPDVSSSTGGAKDSLISLSPEVIVAGVSTWLLAKVGELKPATRDVLIKMTTAIETNNPALLQHFLQQPPTEATLVFAVFVGRVRMAGCDAKTLVRLLRLYTKYS